MQKDKLRSLAFPVTVTGDNTLIPGGQFGVGQGSISVYKIILQSGGSAVTIIPKSGTTVIPGALTLGANPISLICDGEPYWKCLPGQALVLNMSSNAVLTGAIYYALA